MKKVNEEIIQFVKDGVFRAGEAYNSIKLFEDSMKSIWYEVLNEFKEWGDFDPNLKNTKFNHSNRPYLGEWMVVIVQGNKRSDNIQRDFQLEFNLTPGLCAAWRNEPKFFEYDGKVKTIECENTWSSVLCFKPNRDEEFDIKERYTTLMKELLRYV